MSTLSHTQTPPPPRNGEKPFLERFGEYAFRPLFLLLVLQAIGMIIFWVLSWSGAVAVAWERNPVYWHGHEMISGFAGAAIAGFTLTAVANWTSRPPVGGLRLWLLCLLWIGGRVSLFVPWAQALFDAGFWLLLWALLANEVVRAGNRRNYKIAGILGLLVFSDIAWHIAELSNSDLLQQFTWGQLWLVILLISIMGGRVIPAFTGNWLRRRAAATGAAPEPLPPGFTRFDLLCLVALGAFALCTLLPLPPLLGLGTGMLAAVLHAWRLSRWQGHRCLSDPLIWMMHLSYAWIPVGLALSACTAMGWLPASAGLHALTVGCVAGMIVSVSARAALGHTNRPLHSHPLLTAAIVLINVTAVLRISAALAALPMLMPLSALVWVAAFVCYGVVYIPILVGPPAR